MHYRKCFCEFRTQCKSSVYNPLCYLTKNIGINGRYSSFVSMCRFPFHLASLMVSACWFKVLNSSKSGVYNAERHIRDYKVLRTLHFEEIAEEAVTPWFDSVSQRAPQFGRDNSKWRTFGKWNFIFEKETAPNGIMSDTNSHTRRSYTSQKWTSFIGKNMNLEKNIRYYLRLFVVLSCTMKI